MAQKKITPPIDRPLSKAYLREFTGWSTEYPPGLSEPNSLRIMENVWISREGAARIRPGLNSIFKPDVFLSTPCVGSFEHFWLNDGSKAILFAVRETNDTVGFRVGKYEADNHTYDILTLAEAGFEVPQGESELRFSEATAYVRYLQIDNKIVALSDAGEPMRLFYVGTTKRARKVQEISRPGWVVADKPRVIHPDPSATEGSGSFVGLAERETPTAGTANDAYSGTLVSSTDADNLYSYGYWYTFTNEIGESAPSQVTVLKAKRKWTGWMWKMPNAAGEPTGADSVDPSALADQIHIQIPKAIYDEALVRGAERLNVYMTTWSNQDSVPVEGVLVESKEIAGKSFAEGGWVRHTAAQSDYSVLAPLPTVSTIRNYSAPPRAAQGIVAGDRLILVNDRLEGAVVRWSSNQQGEYTNFTANRGGGYKTLTTGNLYIPACVKLWQNPQSVDTLTILCLGADGYSTGFYMAPAEVTSQSQAEVIMGFEETTATPGTVSPFGCEVVNNALYHPLEEQLTKSTANNYNISHKEMTAQIRNKWVDLHRKGKIVSCEHDGRIWFLVHHLDGEPLDEHCVGNELWVLDTIAEGGTWSRFLVQGVSLRKIELNDKIHMAITKPEGIFIFNVESGLDDVQVDGVTVQKPIPWRLETNTQGANRAHDAWCQLQQLEVTVGNFQGSLEYGVRGWTVHGKALDVSKILRDLTPSSQEIFPKSWDLTDYLRVQYAGDAIKEWRFYAQSVEEPEGLRPSYGQINTVQYRYTPVSVNVGYEFGTVESFEYGRVVADSPQQTTDSGTPRSYVDVRRP